MMAYELEQLNNIQRIYEKALEETNEDNYKQVNDEYFQVNMYGTRSERNGHLQEPYHNLNLGLLLDEYYRKIVAMFENRWHWKDNPVPNDKKMGKMLEMWDELISRTWEYYTDPCDYRTNDDSNRHICKRECDDCVSKRFWEGIIAHEGHHFVDDDNRVHFISPIGEGGYCNRTFVVQLDGGEPFECGLWCNGTCTDNIARRIPKGKVLRIV